MRRLREQRRNLELDPFDTAIEFERRERRPRDGQKYHRGEAESCERRDETNTSDWHSAIGCPAVVALSYRDGHLPEFFGSVTE